MTTRQICNEQMRGEMHDVTISACSFKPSAFRTMNMYYLEYNYLRRTVAIQRLFNFTEYQDTVLLFVQNVNH